MGVRALKLDSREAPPEESGELLTANQVAADPKLWNRRKRGRWVNENMGPDCGKWDGRAYLYYRAHAKQWIAEYLDASTERRRAS